MINSVQSQTTVSAGSVSGTWQKSGSPYKINGNIYIPKGSKLTITEGVTVEFQGNYKLDAWGTIQVLGKANDTVVFTSKDKTAGWNGIAVHGQTTTTDSILFVHAKIEFIGHQGTNVKSSVNFGLLLDTVPRLRISNSSFFKNKGAIASCIRATKCSIYLYSTSFMHNRVYDGTSSTGGTAGTAGCVLQNCKLVCFNNNFIKNTRSIPNYGVLFYGAMLELYDGDIEIYNNIFKDNGKTVAFKDNTIGVSLEGKFKGHISNNKFVNNDGGISIDQIDKITIKNNYFESNGESVGMFFSGSGTVVVSNILIDSNVCYKNKYSQFIKSASSNQNIKFINHKQLNSDFGIDIHGIDNCYIENSIFANNKIGISADFNGNLIAYNSIFVNSKTDLASDPQLDTMGSGIRLGDGISFYANNCVFSGNRSADGKLKNFNIIYDNLPSYIYAKNCIIEGGKKTINLQKPTNLGAYENIIESSPLFVSPTAGAGPSYDASLADWHPLNTCAGLSKTFNAGTSTLPFGANLPAYDIDGKARVAQGRVDIGPYEIQSNILPRVFTQPRDTAFCAGATSSMMPFTGVGANVNYSWQSSADGNVWSAVGSQSTNQLNSIKVPQAGPVYYRSIIINPNCSKGDTTRSAMLTVNPLPKPNLGADQTLPNGGSVVLNPGSFTSYNWYKGATTPTYTADKSNLDTGKNKVWVEVTDSKGCKGRDTVIIDLRPVNGLRSITEAGIKLYPVPTNDELTIEVPKNQTYSYEIRDLQGKAIISKTRINTTATKVNLKDLPVGVYVIVIGIEGNYYSGKLIRR